MFHVGQLVVCVDDGCFLTGGYCPLEKGRVYTVAALTGEGEAGPTLSVDEEPETEWHDGTFRCSRFRPITKTDISIFQAMLAPQKVGA